MAGRVTAAAARCPRQGAWGVRSTATGRSGPHAKVRAARIAPVAGCVAQLNAGLGDCAGDEIKVRTNTFITLAHLRVAFARCFMKRLRDFRANRRAHATFKTLTRQNLFALAFRTNNMKTPAGRAKKIATLVAMLARGETIVPQKKA